MDLYSLYYLSLALQGAISLLLASWVWFKAGAQPGMKPLALFCGGVGLWGIGQLGINLGGATVGQLGKVLLNLGPLNAVCFLHFVQRFLERRNDAVLKVLYAGAGALTVAVTALGMGDLRPWLGFQHFYFFPVGGWIPGLFVSLTSIAAYLMLLFAWPGAAPKKRGQIGAVVVAGVWGSASTLMFLNPSFGIDVFPYSVMFLPLYAVLLVFGILRYDLMELNLWANRFLAWLVLGCSMVAVAALLLSVAARIGFAPMAAVPLWQLWLLASVMLATMLSLERPVRRAMERMVFPGAHLEAGVLARWRDQLEAAASWSELASVASSALSAHLRQPMPVVLAAPGGDAGPSVHCYQGAPGNWRTDLVGWEGATPSVRRVGEVFCALLAAAAARLDQLLRYAEQEKQRLREAHLLELGGLAATVAHELRNPLNIISMAAVSSPDATRAEIRAQIERADHLIQDLLTYSGELRLNRQPVALAQLVRSVLPAQAQAAIDVAIPADLQVEVDRLRGEQILGNLVNNALAMLRGRLDARVLIEAERRPDGQVAVRVADNGPGVAPDLVPHLFQPFKTRRPGGTGLGLTIVRRLTEAHGGKVELVAREGWSCCFELLLPGAP
ncbi:MAG: ATP-binding protein [Gammaproteobacteria bacterium]